MHLVSYEILWEPIAENPADFGITAADLDRIAQMSQDLHDHSPKDMVETLERLVEEFPQIPKVWNHLAVAYQYAGRTGDAERIIEETFRRFPSYLFSLANYGLQRIRQGHPEDVAKILNGRFAIHELEQGRRRYHVSEFRTFNTLLAMYFLAIKDYEQAAIYADILEQLDPDHPQTQMVRSQMMLSLSEIMLGDGP